MAPAHLRLISDINQLEFNFTCLIYVKMYLDWRAERKSPKAFVCVKANENSLFLSSANPNKHEPF